MRRAALECAGTVLESFAPFLLPVQSATYKACLVAHLHEGIALLAQSEAQPLFQPGYYEREASTNLGPQGDRDLYAVIERPGLYRWRRLGFPSQTG
jgi:hypothetical protein